MKLPFRRSPRDVACIEFVELVTDYLEQSLSAPDRRAFEHHLADCEGCTSYLAQMRETRRLTGVLQVEDVPAEGIDELLVAFRQYQARSADEPAG